VGQGAWGNNITYDYLYKNHPIKSWTGSHSNLKCHFLYTIL